MTLRIVDVSKYQIERANPLTLVAAQRAGFGAVNIALDRGRAQDVLSGWAPQVAAEARSLGMGISTYRWLDNRLTGALSARRAYDRIVSLGGPNGIAHAVDVEDNAPEQTVRDYVTEMTRLLGRPIALYTGDWWWTAKSRGWSMASIAPYLWAAPNVGYLGTYPGDESPHWNAGYGGWPTLTVMQYAVAPLPGTGDCSLSAVRDMAAWSILTGGSMRARNMQRLTDDIREEFGSSVTVWGKGDLAHQGSSSDHNEDDTPGSRPEQTDDDNIPEHRGIDVPFLGGFNLAKAKVLRQRLTDRPANRARLRYVILEQTIWRKNGEWKPERYNGEFHNHLHVSGDVKDDNNVTRWDIGPDAPQPKPAPTTGRDEQGERDMLITFIYETTSGKTRWGMGLVSAGQPLWFEANTQGRANGYSVAAGINATQVTAAEFDAEKKNFVSQAA